MTDIQIQPATEADVPLILQLIKALAEYERLGDEVVATEAMIRESFFGAAPHAQGSHRAHRRRRGWIRHLVLHLFDLPLEAGHLPGRSVRAARMARQRRSAARLLRHLARIAVERGCGRIEWSVLDWNETAIRFYRNIGASPMDEWTVYRLTGEAITTCRNCESDL